MTRFRSVCCLQFVKVNLLQLLKSMDRCSGRSHVERLPAGDPSTPKRVGDVVQLVRTLPCHGRGRGFESRRPRHVFQALANIFDLPSWSNLVHLGQCPVSSQHAIHELALRQSLLLHADLRIRVERDATVRMTQ